MRYPYNLKVGAKAYNTFLIQNILSDSLEKLWRTKEIDLGKLTLYDINEQFLVRWDFRLWTVAVELLP